MPRGTSDRDIRPIAGKPNHRRTIGQQQVAVRRREMKLTFGDGRAKLALRGDGGPPGFAPRWERVACGADSHLAIASGFASPLAALDVEIWRNRLVLQHANMASAIWEP